MRTFLQGNVVATLLWISIEAANDGHKAACIRAFIATMLAVAATDWRKP